MTSQTSGCVRGGFNFRLDSRLVSDQPHAAKGSSYCYSLADKLIDCGWIVSEWRRINFIENNSFNEVLKVSVFYKSL